MRESTTNLTKMLNQGFKLEGTETNCRVVIPDCTIKTGGRRDFTGDVKIQITPAILRLAKNHNLFENRLYGKEVSDKIAAAIFHRNFRSRNYGLLAGESMFHGDDLYFTVDTKPETNNVNSVLFYSDASLIGFAGINGLTCFTYKTGKLYGVIVPLYLLEKNQVFAGKSLQLVRINMEKYANHFICD